jgi:ectoine hydroxylase-related dioxygenase (phytanoyl-CoA dioxygenase family)
MPNDVDGFQLRTSVLGPGMIQALIEEISAQSVDDRAGTRRLLASPLVHDIATQGPVFELVARVLGNSAFPVRAILFDKRPDVNWDLGYHQDRAIAVKERREVQGFHGWSVKEGVPHVLPPASVLEGMLSARIHLDDCGEENGPLRVSPGTHRLGIIEKADAPRIVLRHGEAVCTCPAGAVLLMRPLLLHASSKSVAPSHRRVVHIEYANSSLPGGLEWFEV